MARRSEQGGKANFNEMSVLAFNNVVLLGGVRTGHTVRDAHALKIAMQLMTFTTPVRLN
jgi:hypothetical protein